MTTNAGVYSTVLSHISSWGYVVIGPWSALSIPTTTYEAKWVEPVLDWARTHLDPRSETNYGIHPGRDGNEIFGRERLTENYWVFQKKRQIFHS